MTDHRKDNSKVLSVLTLALALVGLSAGAARAAEPAPIEAVVVYGDRAQVTRSRDAACARGEAVFAGLPSTLLTETLYAGLRGKGEVLGVSYKEVASGPQPEAKAVQEKIRAIDRKLVRIAAELKDGGALQLKLESFKRHMSSVWGRQARGKGPAVQTWSKALDLLRKEALAGQKRRVELQAEERDLRWQRQLLVADLQRIQRKRRRTTLSVTVHLRCQGRATATLSYMVPGATWSMAYRVRAEPGAGKVSLTVRGLVQQGTGEDWEGVKLSVSTANLQRKNVPPDIRTMRVAAQKPATEQKVLTRRFEQRRNLQTAPSGGEQAPAAPAGEADQGLAVDLPAAGKVTVPSNGRVIEVVLARRTLAAREELETVPKLYPHVYRKVPLKNPFGFALLPGPADLMEGRSFIGRTWLKLRGPREPFAVTLGVKNGMQVKRYVKREKLQPPGALSGEQKLLHRYALDVGNWTKTRQKVRVLENIPVSRIREVKVTVGKDTTPTTKLDQRNGIATWELDLAPRTKKVIVLDYTVSLPKEYQVRGYSR